MMTAIGNVAMLATLFILAYSLTELLAIYSVEKKEKSERKNT